MKKPEVYLLLPNIRSGFNVGSLLRTADGLGVKHVFLCGYTPYPPHVEIAKTALGAEDFVSWSFHLDALELLAELKAQGFEIIALEKTAQSMPIGEHQKRASKTCLIVGNEVEGVDTAMLQFADCVLEIPMRGQKTSFNVATAGAIGLFALQEKI